MGIYVEFIRCPPDGPLAQIVEHIDDYRAWYADSFAEFAEEVDAALLDLMTAVAERGIDALDELGPASYPVIDRWVANYYGSYCDGSSAPALPTVETSMLKLHRYHTLHEEVAGLLTPEVSALWRFIYTGRPVAPPGRDTVYISDDDASWVSWWSLAEVRLLRRSLPSWTVICATVGADVLDEMSEHVLASMRGALEAAEESGCGLVVTAF